MYKGPPKRKETEKKNDSEKGKKRKSNANPTGYTYRKIFFFF